ncbi:flagellar export protein FliJ [Shewanella sp. 202IG2-18]|uniref:flagellar export protein FliJ n=1 Tax=Parashewanella hymeniacidonis TaxID=2807618 RepID=UPI001961D662|nr:flagellar export protein FliJ [Parashewanella hymeniacidonis]MBM7072224.1 flagellar export protein FliJ [Parashewanella hymeniacidonis]
MIAKDPLFTVLKLATEAEEQASLQFRSATMDVQKAQSQLDALNQYRLDYMTQMKAKVGTNLTSSQYQQFHKFIAQIDQAVSQQVLAVKETEKIKEHRQKNWLEKQQKRKAVESLLDKKALKRQQAEAKSEQKLFDEFAVQQYFRNKQLQK